MFHRASPRYLPCSDDELDPSLRWDVSGLEHDDTIEIAYAHRSRIDRDEAVRGAAYRRTTDRVTGETVYAWRADVAALRAGVGDRRGCEERQRSA